MTRSIVNLPHDVGEEFEVYINGVRKSPASTSTSTATRLSSIAPSAGIKSPRGDGCSAPGAWSTYRQDDTVDVRYEHDGEMRLAHALAITLRGEGED